MKLEQTIRCFLVACSAILGITGLLKLVSVFGHDRILQSYDPLFGIQTRFILIIAGAIDVFIATALIRSKNSRSSHWLVSWVGFKFLLYRGFPVFSRNDNQRPCLGTIFGWLKLNALLLNGILMALSSLMFLGDLVPRAQLTSPRSG